MFGFSFLIPHNLKISIFGPLIGHNYVFSKELFALLGDPLQRQCTSVSEGLDLLMYLLQLLCNFQFKHHKNLLGPLSKAFILPCTLCVYILSEYSVIL